ncbi:MAG: hypothetical protein EMLJLAPB_00596 [Candidatus Argoarchaeum ethanivorans]|uniref:Uncharacterized protein n=1 Tax=Candidatus Argoarchaeum ethanivorans TaxID=2608793 RepID=A0A811TD36_9EURY|nr:MAG: hypothetical protein EMLJLAPB_00596 [Candidatus Argoarchaeum ethanivorans]
MNKINMIKTVTVLIMVTLTLTLTIAASGWQQFRTDGANAGIAADSAPVAAPDDMTTCDVQIALQGAADFDEGTEPGNDAGYLHGLANWTRYDFCVGAGGEDGAEKKWAYGKQTSGNPPTANNDPNTEFSTKYSPSQYDKIKVDDGVFKSDVTNANGNYAVHRFNFTILESTADISKINVTWNGTGWHDSGTQYNGTYLYIWNFTSGAYEELAHTDSGAEVTLTGENASSASNYINSDNVTVLAEQKSADDGEDHSHIATDYVKLEVTR